MKEQRELRILGIVIRLNCTTEEFDHMQDLALQLESIVSDIKNSHKILQLDKLLCMAALTILDNPEAVPQPTVSANFLENFASIIKNLDDNL